jgi:hypothetical protein
LTQLDQPSKGFALISAASVSAAVRGLATGTTIFFRVAIQAAAQLADEAKTVDIGPAEPASTVRPSCTPQNSVRVRIPDEKGET